MRSEDLILPASVSVVFPALRDGLPSATQTVYSITLVSLNLSTLSGVVGRTGFVRVLHSSAVAGYSTFPAATPSNDAELQALANQIATDFYLHVAGRAEVCLSGIQPWLPSGLEDVTEWDHSGEHIVTRSRPCAWTDGPDTLWQHGTHGSASPPTTGGMTYVGGDVEFIDVDVTHAGGTLSLLGTTTTFADGTLQFASTDVDLLLEDDTLILLEDGVTGIYVQESVALLESSLFLHDFDAILLESGDPILLETSLYLHDESGVSLTIYGGGRLQLATWLEVCDAWTWCYATMPPVTTSQTGYTLPRVPIARVPVNWPDITFHGLIPAVPGQHITLINTGTDSATIAYESPSAAQPPWRVLTPGLDDATWAPGETVRLWHDTTSLRWRLEMGPTPSAGFTTYTISEDTDNWSLPAINGKPPSVVRITVDNDWALTGIEPTTVNQTVTLWNDPDSPGILTITSEDPSSLTANQIVTPTGGDIALAPGQTLELARNSTTGQFAVVGGTAVSYDDTPAPEVTLSTSQNDYVLDNPTPYQFLDVTTAISITGFEPLPGLSTFTATNTGTGMLTIPHQSGSSTAANRVTTPTGASLLIPPGSSITLQYDPTIPGWRVPGGSAVSAPGAITLPLLTTAPGTPPAGYATLYADSDGDVVRKTSSGSVVPVGLSAEGALILSPITPSSPASGDLALYSASGTVSIKDSSGTVSTLGGRSEGTLAATGSVQGDAAAIVTDAVEVSGADGTKGVILPSRAGALIVVTNTDGGNSLKVYPNSGAQIGSGGANVAATHLAGSTVLYARTSSTQWRTQTFL